MLARIRTTRYGQILLRATSLFLATVVSGALCIDAAFAHAGDQAFVLLLPTGVYTTAGVAAVGATVLVLAIVPRLGGQSFFASFALFRQPALSGGMVASLFSFILLIALVVIGFVGSRDPLANPLPLAIWTVWWIGLVSLAALIGNFWAWLNPWTGLHHVLVSRSVSAAPLRLPERLGSWPGILAFTAFAIFLLADLAPTDPARLASAVILYGLVTLFGMTLFGADAWLARCEGLTMLMRHYASLAPIGVRGGKIRLGAPGWQIVSGRSLSISGGLFVLLLLGTGSFDGLNETFWWLALIGINPLEFPGRSAVFWQTVSGFLIANLLLVGIFAACVWTGLRIADVSVGFSTAFGRLVLSILPIAVGYHIAHYLTAFLVDVQYALAALSDPFANGSDYLGLGTFYVTTGFFKTRGSVQLIWLSQAGAIVIGHILSVLVAHAIAMDLLKVSKKAVISLIPLSIFMILYTLFGLWLLASPRGA